MESSIEYKGIVFVYDEGIGTYSKGIYVIQNNTYRASYSTFAADTYVTNFLIRSNKLYAMVSDGKLLELVKITDSVSLDEWTELGQFPDSINFAVIYKDYIYAFTNTTYYKWYQGDIPTSGVSIGITIQGLYNAVNGGNYLYLYGRNVTTNLVWKFNGTTFSEVYENTEFSFAVVDYEFYYRPNGKSLILENDGVIYFQIKVGSNYSILGLNIEDDLIKIFGETTSKIFTSLSIEDDVLFAAQYDIVLDESNVRMYPIVNFKIEKTLVSGNGDTIDKLWRIESDPVFPSPQSKEELFYSQRYMCITSLKGDENPIVKYGNRREFYTNLNFTSSLNMPLKNVVDDICNLLDVYFIFKPNNLIEVGINDLVGKSGIEFTISDDQWDGDAQIQKLTDSFKGTNNFKRVVIGWSDLNNSGEENIGLLLGNNVDEFERTSVLCNDAQTAKNIASYLFSRMTESEGYTFDLGWCPFLSINDNVKFHTIGNFLYINKEDEYKIIECDQNFDQKFTTIKVLKRNITYETLI